MSTGSSEATTYIAKMWKEPVLRQIAEMQFKEAQNPDDTVPYYDTFVPGSKMEFWDINEVMR